MSLSEVYFSIADADLPAVDLDPLGLALAADDSDGQAGHEGLAQEVRVLVLEYSSAAFAAEGSPEPTADSQWQTDIQWTQESPCVSLAGWNCHHYEASHREAWGRNGDTPSVPSSCLLYTSPSPRDGLLSRMPSSA